ncbi:hypothetical protein M8C21_032791 [Ambrosia artemisiifolia]|uniref:O-fucosyltransferase family protein n=1 Tax=Ambrosia artemisiifolia TaxID=4212 RepID=A0AAD5GN41_AMBAR|nr:hypothetical protein M8C21_032791 [Ambrosia artemisiifolia]
MNSRFTDEELRNQGRCSLTPEEIGLLLAALGFDNTTRLYLASHKVYGGEARIAALRQLFPYMEGKKSLASSAERAKIKGKASLSAAVDYYVSMHSDIFISAKYAQCYGRTPDVPQLEDNKTKHGVIGSAFHEQKHELVRFSRSGCGRATEQAWGN